MEGKQEGKKEGKKGGKRKDFSQWNVRMHLKLSGLKGGPFLGSLDR